MIEQIEAIEHEQVDDIPLLMSVIKQMGIVEIFNQQIEAHGNWQGIGVGEIIAVWLAYILSEGDHRKCYLQEWVKERERLLKQSLEVAELNAMDFTDDRLGLVLSKLNDDEVWQGGEQAVNERIVRVYDLEPETVRVDTTTVSGYGRVTKEGLLQFGYSKDHRPDLGQVKIASASLDPLGLPLVTIPVRGERGDDPLYLPVIKQARPSLGDKKGLLYVGDSKMGAIEIRGELTAQGDYYLMPLSKVQLDDDTLNQYLAEFEAQPASETQEGWQQLVITDDRGQTRLLAEGFTVEVELERELIQNGSAQKQTWSERRLVVHSPQYAAKQRQQLQSRLAQAEAAILKLTQRRKGYQYPKSQAELEDRVADLLTKHDCAQYLQVEIRPETIRRQIRAYGDRPARLEQTVQFQITCQQNQAAVSQAGLLMGWRVYATTAPEQRLSFQQAVEVYRDAYLHEHGYARLKGKPLSLTPMFVQKDDQITGLVRLLSLALRPLTLIEFVVREQLTHQDRDLTGVYAGNRNRKTRTPRTETLLRVFKGIALIVIRVNDREWLHLSPLTPTQKRILHLLGLPETVYTSLVSESAIPL